MVMKKDMVYEVPCEDCSEAYVGEMGRGWQKRLVEHKTAVKTETMRLHGTKTTAGVWVLEIELHYWERRALEAIWIQKH